MLEDVSWFIPNRVTLAVFSDVLTMTDYEQSNQQVAQLIAQLDDTQKQERFHFIIDTSRIKRIDRSMMNLKRLHTATIQSDVVQQYQDSWYIVVDADPNPIMSFLTQTVMQVMKLRYRILPSMEAALAFLQEQDKTLTDANTRGG